MNNIILEEARLWLNKEQDGLDLNACRDFSSWLENSSKHKDVFEEEKSFRASFVNLPSDILSSLSFENNKEIKQDKFFLRIKRISLSAALFFLLIFASYFTYDSYLPSFEKLYITSTDINKKIELPDNSILSLDKYSSIRVSYYKDKREVQLLKGKVLFNVASNKTRPFRIEVNNTLVEVLGTKFEIQRFEDRVNISVIEGRVSVREVLNNSKTKILAVLQKSDSLSVNNLGEILSHTQVNEKLIAAWEKDKLLFEQTYLKDVVKEFSKYLNYKVQIESKDLEVLPISGNFSISDFENLMNSLSVIHPLSIQQIENTFYIKKKL